MRSLVVAILVLLLGGSFAHSIAGSEVSGEIGDEAIPGPNQISVWYQTPLGKFNVMPVQPIRESSQRDRDDLERCAWIYDGPSPYSHFRRAIVIERTTDFTIFLLDSAGVAADSLTYVGVEPGWYGLLFGTTDEVESIRIRSDGRIVGEWNEIH